MLAADGWKDVQLLGADRAHRQFNCHDRQPPCYIVAVVGVTLPDAPGTMLAVPTSGLDVLEVIVPDAVSEACSGELSTQAIHCRGASGGHIREIRVVADAGVHRPGEVADRCSGLPADAPSVATVANMTLEKSPSNAMRRAGSGTGSPPPPVPPPPVPV